MAQLEVKALPHRVETNMLRVASRLLIESCGLPVDGGLSHTEWCSAASKHLCPAGSEKKRLQQVASAKRSADKKKALAARIAPTPTGTLV